MKNLDENLFLFPNMLEIPNANLDGLSVKFCVISLGFILVKHKKDKVYFYRILHGLCGIRFELYDSACLSFLGQFQYEEFSEIYADLMRFSTGDLDFEFNEDHEIIGKIYHYKSE